MPGYNPGIDIFSWLENTTDVISEKIPTIGMTNVKF